MRRTDHGLQVERLMRRVKDLKILLTNSDQCFSLVHEEELQCLARYFFQCKGIAVEIGTYKGGTTSSLSRMLPNGARLVTIDPYISDSMVTSLQGSRHIAMLNVMLHGNILRVRFIKDFSYNVAQSWNKPIDLLWIDGSHQYQDVRRDFDDWSRYVVRNGFILIHDSNKVDLSDDSVFDNGWVGPSKLCVQIKSDLQNHFKHIEAVRSINVFQKLGA